MTGKTNGGRSARMVGRSGLAMPVAMTLALLVLAVPGPASAQVGASNASPVAGGVKTCSPFVPNGWRSISPVPTTWDMTDCSRFAGGMGASHAQVGCIFETVVPPHDKFSWGEPWRARDAPQPKNRPTGNCGW